MDTVIKVKSRDSTIIACHRSGAGPPLLLVHGATADHQRWSAISPQFEQRFSVFAMDRRGRGLSGDGPDYQLQREAEDVAAVVDAIGGPVFVLGHSFGALCCLEAMRLTGRVDRLILYEPPLQDRPPIPADIPVRLQALIDQGQPEKALDLFFGEVVRMPDAGLRAYRRLPMWKRRVALAPTLARELAAVQAYEFEPQRFGEIKTPVALLLGGDSPQSVHQATALVAEALQDSRIIVLPGQQHVAMDTSPELFVSEVQSFLSEKDV